MGKHRAFTLFELMVTMVIITILAATLSVGYNAYMKKAESRATSSFMAKVEAALQMYRQDNRQFPEFQGTWADGDWGMAQDNAHMLYQTLYIDTEYLTDAVVNPDAQMASHTDVMDIEGRRMLVDYWSKPLVYIAFQYEKDDAGEIVQDAYNRPIKRWPPGAPLQKSRHIHSYELWSAGSDQMFDNLHTGDGDGDNIRAPGL